MALITCPVCKNQISDKAAVCPHCEHPLQPGVRKGGGVLKSMNLGWVGIAAIIAVVLLFLLLGTCKWHPLV